MSLFLQYLIVGLGGALGAMSRFGVEHLGIFENDKYYYTVAINITGCLTIGVLFALFEHWNIPKFYYLWILTGFLGGYTTYSAFTLDAMQLLADGMMGRAIFYVGVTLIGGLGGCALGLFGTRFILNNING